MTEHLYPDDQSEVNFDSAEDVVSSGVSDPIPVDWAGLPGVVVKSRHGDERKFTIISKNCVEYSFEDDGHVGCSTE